MRTRALLERWPSRRSWCSSWLRAATPATTTTPAARPATRRPRPSGAADLTKNVPVHGAGRDRHRDQGRGRSRRRPTPSPASTPQLADGIKAYFDMVNADGGIYGRKLVIAKRPRRPVIGLQNTADRCRRASPQDNAFATFIATTAVHRRRRCSPRRKQPTFIWNINPEFAGHANFFANDGALCFTLRRPRRSRRSPSSSSATKVGVLAYGIAHQSKDVRAGHQGLVREVPDGARSCSTTTRSASPQPDLSAAGRADEGEGRRLRHDLHRPAASRSRSPRRCRSRA